MEEFIAKEPTEPGNPGHLLWAAGVHVSDWTEAGTREPGGGVEEGAEGKEVSASKEPWR